MIESYKEFKEYLKTIKDKPKLLLHSCCGPCSSYTLLFLKEYFDVDIYYYNDNIFPEDEYYTRLLEQMKVANAINKDTKILTESYNDSNYYKAIRGYEDLGEHSLRCYMCYKFRMENTAKKALELGYDYFTTTLSISPYKNSEWINEIGYMLEEKYKIKYLYSNFKKEEGYKKSIELSREYDLYRQDYCGCVFSYNDREDK